MYDEIVEIEGVKVRIVWALGDVTVLDGDKKYPISRGPDYAKELKAAIDKVNGKNNERD